TALPRAAPATSGGRPTAGRRPATHPPAQPVPPLARPDLPRVGLAHQGPRRRLGPRTRSPLPHGAVAGPGNANRPRQYTLFARPPPRHAAPTPPDLRALPRRPDRPA